jgi:prepilin-type processing-associated H-X9-DG protein
VENVGIQMKDITDGTNCTILAGEKHVPIGYFGVGWLDNSTYNGDYLACYTRGASDSVGLAQSLDDPGWKFGSYHIWVCQFVFCDGHVEGIRHNIDPEILFLLVQRDDGQVIPDY